AIEGRDWAKLFDAQAGPGHPRVARPHLPAYNEVAPLIYGRKFEEYSRTTAAFLGPHAELYPELENSMWTPQVKSNKIGRASCRERVKKEWVAYRCGRE